MKNILTLFAKSRVMLTSIPKFHFCQSNQSKNEGLRELLHLYEQQADKAKITSQLIQLQPHFHQMTTNQQKAIAQLFFNAADYDEQIAVKIFETALASCLEEKGNLRDTLETISYITSPLNSEEFCEKQIKFIVSVVKSPFLDSQSFAYALLIYGKLLQIQYEKNGMLEFEFARHAEYVNKFTSKSLSIVAQGVMLSELKEKLILELLDNQSQKTEMNLMDLIRVATALVKFQGGSEEFWLYFSNEIKNKVSQIKPASLILLKMIGKNGGFDTNSIWQTIEVAFLNLYNDLQFEDKALLFSDFAAISYKSIELWKKLDNDHQEIMKKCKALQSIKLIFECLNIFEILKQETQQNMLIYITDNTEHIEQKFRDLILKRAVKKGILTKEEVGL